MRRNSSIKIYLAGIFCILVMSLSRCDDAVFESIEDEARTLVNGFSYFSISDTNRDEDFSQAGDDASHAELAKPSFIDRGDGTVIDRVSGLLWLKCPLNDDGSVDTSSDCSDTHHGLFTWNEAMSGCDNLSFNGKDSWRVPTPTEFASIMDFQFGPSDPAVHPVFGEREYTDCSSYRFIPQGGTTEENVDSAYDMIWECSDRGSIKRYWTANVFGNKMISWTFNPYDGHLNVKSWERPYYVRCIANP